MHRRRCRCAAIVGQRRVINATAPASQGQRAYRYAATSGPDRKTDPCASPIFVWARFFGYLLIEQPLFLINAARQHPAIKNMDKPAATNILNKK